ncbi:MAG: response regulator [Methanobacterium sp.]
MHNERILIIEDEAITAMDICNMFQFWGYKTPVIASSEKEALDKAHDIKPDIALINIGIKNNNRIDIAKKINDNYDTAVIYVTGHFNEEIMQYLRVSRPYGYISKPFDENQLKYTVEKAIYRRNLHRRIIASK